ncbi:hypothetical protein PHYBLDRAFT_59127 [Phycomyces blakesleeanus NRRL 1555(-)]|uniref:Uncharacterized protein n=1 Tax=Phycomyces blakesleeanus (strain ATCC 8743b / DSM 1359 / FGSC 10004 / NBRC 33097 / NRRL 1555) TaxID=763407 RepID=A0A162Q4V4_PHYB8|nr:hypothetical protein PHYBLDRAFT_59127 [Phycomyces blakesleeanus NRRL 1555(-)]OAD80086.1 hypothetical protein PHYBLDRAFT_59127 [Phycomyces blakesleeanus NRRL 1555(-)]|eukprot:XP_018298126.1 hypothetical protein PHYBLDRAFT_59127 [Phycomyces blakesleeanus NRRL 1555(-)]
MLPLPTNITAFKRRFVNEHDLEELEHLIEQQEAEISSGIQPTSIAAISEEVPKKARRGQPSKRIMLVENSTAVLWGENKAKYNIDKRIRENLCRLFISKENVCLSNLYHDESSSRSIVFLKRSGKTN